MLKLPRKPSHGILEILRACGCYRRACGGGGCWYMHDPILAATRLQQVGAADLAAAVHRAARSRPSDLVISKLP